MKRSLAKAKALFLSLLLLAAPGCSRESVQFSFDEVRYAVTGGVAGFDRSMRIADDGSYQVREGGRVRESGRLSGAQLVELKRLMKAVDWENIKTRYIDGRVVDSLDQTVEFRRGRVSYITTAGTGGDPPEPVAALLAFLSTAMQEAL